MRGSYFYKPQVYEAVVYEIFNNNLGEEDEGGNVEEEVKGASGLLRGLESNLKVILSLKIVSCGFLNFYKVQIAGTKVSFNIYTRTLTRPEDWKVIGNQHQKIFLSLEIVQHFVETFALNPQQGHPEFSINPVFFATCAPLFINASVVIVYRYYRSLSFSYFLVLFFFALLNCSTIAGRS